MPPRPPACHRAVHQQLTAPHDAIWVTDECLRQTFQRFLGFSKTERRYGSSVPGPLESRRRIGKRRMTQLSEAIPTIPHGIATLWGSFGEPDRTRWKWEAPRTPEKKADSSASKLPQWIEEWDTAQHLDPDPKLIQKEPSQFMQTASSNIIRKIAANFMGEEVGPVISTDLMESFEEFQAKVVQVECDERLELCQQFNSLFKQKLILGEVSDSPFCIVLNGISNTLRRAFSEDKYLADCQCLLFYQTAWDGLSSSKIHRLHEVAPTLVNLLVERIVCDLPTNLDAQALVVGIYRGISQYQMSKIEEATAQLFRTWLISCTVDESLPSLPSAQVLAEKAVQKSREQIESVQGIVGPLLTRRISEQDRTAALGAVRSAKRSLVLGLEAVGEVEKSLMPSVRSVKNLAEILEHFPPTMMARMVRITSDYISTICKDSHKPTKSLRYSWLSVVSQTRCTPHTLFLRTWRLMKTSGSGLPEIAFSRVLLSRLVAQGYISNPAMVRNSLDATPGSAGRRGFLTLILAAKKHQKVYVVTSALFEFLFQLGEYRRVYGIMLALNSREIRLPPVLFSKTIEEMARYDHGLALDMYNLYYRLKVWRDHLRLYECPYFLIAMIDRPQMPPFRIWKMLDIPLHETPRSDQNSGNRFLKRGSLSPSMADLITKMAIAFATSDARPPRVAFREVMRCLHLLRRHHAPITPELTRALVRAGLTRKIEAGKWVPKQRVAWVSELIEWTEGREVAGDVNEIVQCWNKNISDKILKQFREQNVLRVGPID